MDIPLWNAPIFVYAFWHPHLKNEYKKEGVFQPSYLILINIKNATTFLIFHHKRD